MKEQHSVTEGDLQQRVKTLTDQLTQINTDHYKLVKANEENTEKLKSELSNSLNAHYLKNVLTSYFTTNDPTVQNNTLKVVFKVMKFSEDEQLNVMERW